MKYIKPSIIYDLDISQQFIDALQNLADEYDSLSGTQQTNVDYLLGEDFYLNIMNF